MAVLRPPPQRSENEHVERALQQVHARRLAFLSHQSRRQFSRDAAARLLDCLLERRRPQAVDSRIVGPGRVPAAVTKGSPSGWPPVSDTIFATIGLVRSVNR